MHSREQIERLADGFEAPVLDDARLFERNYVGTYLRFRTLLGAGRHNVLELQAAVKTAENRVFGAENTHE